MNQAQLKQRAAKLLKETKYTTGGRVESKGYAGQDYNGRDGYYFVMSYELTYGNSGRQYRVAFISNGGTAKTVTIPSTHKQDTVDCAKGLAAVR